MKIITPQSTVIEETALSIAAAWYEVGRGQGLTSKWPNAKAYAKANLERFIPNAVSILLDMLKPDSNCPPGIAPSTPIPYSPRESRACIPQCPRSPPL